MICLCLLQKNYDLEMKVASHLRTQLTMTDNENKASSVRKRQAAKSIAANKRHKKESNKSKRLSQRNLHDLSVSAAKINDFEMKVASHLRTQAALKKSHKNAMAELMFLSHWSKVGEPMWRRTTCVNV